MLENSASFWLTIPLLILLVLAVWSDIQQHRIPNIISLGGIILGITVNTWTSGFTGLLTGVGGVAIGIGLFLPFYLLHGMGAGDVKLMGAAGAFLGPKSALLAAGLSLGAGGMIAIIILISRGGFKPLAVRYLETVKFLFVTGKISHTPPAQGEVAAEKFPYASAIGIGTLATLWWVSTL